MSDYIVGLKEYGDKIVAADKALRKDLAPTDRDLPLLDFRQVSRLPARRRSTRTRCAIRVKGKYPQFKYWLAMTFFAPIPWEAEKFYAQPGMAAKNLTLNYWPVGTGPYMLTEYVENRRHVLERNPNFHGETYPCEGEPGDKEKGYLDDCGKPTPLRRQGRLRHRKGRRAAAGEVPAGLLRLAGDRAPRLRHEHICGDGRRQEEGQGIPRKGHQAAHDDRGEQLVHRLQLARPGRRQGRHTRAGRAQSQAAAGAVDRHRLGGAHRDLRARPGRGRAGAAAAVALRLSRGRAVGVQSGGLHASGPDGKPVRRSLDEAKKLLAEAGYPERPRRQDRQAAGAQFRLPVRRRRPASRRCSTGTRSSSPRSACSSRCARPTTTASRTR